MLNEIVVTVFIIVFVFAAIVLVVLYLYSDIFVEATLTNKRHADYESRLSVNKTTASISTDIRGENV